MGKGSSYICSYVTEAIDALVTAWLQETELDSRVSMESITSMLCSNTYHLAIIHCHGSWKKICTHHSGLTNCIIMPKAIDLVYG